MQRTEAESSIRYIWDAFWAAGLSEPVEIVEQISYMLFLRWLDHSRYLGQGQQDASSRDSLTSGIEVTTWNDLKREPPQKMLSTLQDRVFPWLRGLDIPAVTFTRHLRDARFTIPSPSVLLKVIDAIDALRLDDIDACSSWYDALLSRTASTGRFGRITTPIHVAALMTEMTSPQTQDTICDPACGTARLLAAAAAFVDEKRAHAEDSVDGPEVLGLHGFDQSPSMLRLSSMNLLLRGHANVDTRRIDSLEEKMPGDAGKYSLVLSVLPFSGAAGGEALSKAMSEELRTRKAELLFVQLAMRLLAAGGRAAVVVPSGLLFGNSNAHVQLRRRLVERFEVEGVVSLPAGSFRPYVSGSTGIIFFRNSGNPTQKVWFYQVSADGLSLNDRRQPELDKSLLGATPARALTASEHSRNNLPDVVKRWAARDTSESLRTRSEQSFVVDAAEICSQYYDLSIDRYRTPSKEGIRLGDIADVFVGSTKIDLAQLNSATPNNSSRRVLHPSLLTKPLPPTEELPMFTGSARGRPLKSGDIVGRDLAARRNWAIAAPDYEGVLAGQGVLVVRLREEVISRDYIVAYLETSEAEDQLPRHGVLPRLRHNELSELRLPKCDGEPDVVSSALRRLQLGADEVDKIAQALDTLRSTIFQGDSAEERWSRLREASNQGALVADTLRKYSEPQRTFRDSFPYGIARSVRRLNHSTSSQTKHEAALQCIESLVTSIGIVSLAFLSHWGRLDIPEAQAWLTAVGRGGVSLGHWVGVVRAAGACARDSEDYAGGLADATASKKKAHGLLPLLDDLVARRNKIRHGSGPRTSAEVEKSLGDLEKFLSRSLQASNFLINMPWFFTDQLRWHPTVGTFDVSGLLLMGDHPDFEPARQSIGYPLPQNELYIFPEPSQAVSLAPFCYLRDCPQCLAPELYYPDRLSGSTALLKSLDRGHELDSAEVSSAIGRL